MVLLDNDAIRLSGYLVLVLLYLALAFFVGIGTFNIEYVVLAFHTLFDGSALIASLLAMVASRKPPSSTHSFGFDRYEVLSAFVIATSVFFLALFAIMDGIHGFFAAEEVEKGSQKVFFLTLMGIFVKVVGLVLFAKHAKLPTMTFLKSRKPAGARDLNLHAVWIHVLSDVCAFSGVLISDYSDFLRPIATTTAGIAMIALAWPLFTCSSTILLQQVPYGLLPRLSRAMREIAAIDGVLECHSERWWSLMPGFNVGALKLRVRADVDEQQVLIAANRVLEKHLALSTIQIEKDTPVEWIMQKR
jgi:cation diffusion facilitator family transporter